MLERYAYTESTSDAMADRMIRPPVHNDADDEIADLQFLLRRAMERIDQLERAMERIDQVEVQLVRLEVRLSDVVVQCSDRDVNIGRLERLLNEVAECVTDPEQF